jgi:hypothetical protein
MSILEEEALDYTNDPLEGQQIWSNLKICTPCDLVGCFPG